MSKLAWLVVGEMGIEPRRVCFEALCSAWRPFLPEALPLLVGVSGGWDLPPPHPLGPQTGFVNGLNLSFPIHEMGFMVTPSDDHDY